MQLAIDQQPYVEGYEAVDMLWLYITNGDTVGGGAAVLTGPFFVTKDNAAPWPTSPRPDALKRAGAPLTAPEANIRPERSSGRMNEREECVAQTTDSDSWRGRCACTAHSGSRLQPGSRLARRRSHVIVFFSVMAAIPPSRLSPPCCIKLRAIGILAVAVAC